MTSSAQALPDDIFEKFQKKEYAHCIERLEILAGEGSTPAAIALAHIFFYGGGGVSKSYKKARRWLELIHQDDRSAKYATYRLGIIYYKGLGIQPNHLVAYKFFRRGAIQDDPKSLLMAAAMQKEGDGVMKKPRSARVIFTHCARDKRLNVADRLLAYLWKTCLLGR